MEKGEVRVIIDPAYLLSNLALQAAMVAVMSRRPSASQVSLHGNRQTGHGPPEEV